MASKIKLSVTEDLQYLKRLFQWYYNAWYQRYN